MGLKPAIQDVCLVVLLLMGNSFEFCQTGTVQQIANRLQDEPETIREIRMGKDSPPEYAITTEDSDIVRLHKERINFLYTAKNELLMQYEVGDVSLDKALITESLLSEARIDFHQDPQHTATILEEELKQLKHIEAMVNQQFLEGGSTSAEVCLSGYYRASCELRLKKHTSGTPN